ASNSVAGPDGKAAPEDCPIQIAGGGRGRLTNGFTMSYSPTAMATPMARRASGRHWRRRRTKKQPTTNATGTMTAVDPNQVATFITPVSHSVLCATTHAVTR